MFAVGAEDSPRSDDMELAKGLTATCHEMYKRTATGIGSEIVQFTAGQDFVVPPNARHYLLRPGKRVLHVLLMLLQRQWKAFLYCGEQHTIQFIVKWDGKLFKRLINIAKLHMATVAFGMLPVYPPVSTICNKVFSLPKL